MTLEAVVLTGGRSSRMGHDKATIDVDGTTLVTRIVAALKSLNLPVTVLGPHLVDGATQISDRESFAGPLVALAGFQPQADAVFVCSCDLAKFDPKIITFLTAHIGPNDAAVPMIDGFAQPVCALYRASAFGVIDAVRKSMMSWLDQLTWKPITDQDWIDAGIDPRSILGVNTEAELAAALATQ